MKQTSWATDGEISMPVVPTGAKLVDYGGFAFTEFGLAHNIDEGDLEEMLFPTFAPMSYVPGTAKGVIE